jgi:D-serine deaminase-like pyridoxal phosphate-dependent protein|tara:strand:- start:1233 stop:1556 length:324 start_codon:yes stop_codon:yes gene_type:complete
VFTSVVSKANDNRGILDAGSKTLTSDTGGLKGFGYITEYPEANIIKFSEEHGFLELKDCKNKPSIGDIVTVIPNHVCVAVNMVDKLVMVQNNKIIKTIPVAARGMLV